MQEHDLLRRIERLEREGRRWRRAATLGLVLAVAGLASAWRSVPDELEASRFVLRGADGAEAAVLGPDGHGNPSLMLTRGKARAFLTLSGPGLLLRGDDGRRGAFLGFDTRGTTQLSLSSPRGSDGVRLEVGEEGSASLAALDATGRKRAHLHFSASDDSAGLTVSDGTGRPRASLVLDEGRTPALLLLDEQGVRRMGALLDADEEGLPAFAMLDQRGRPRIELSTTFDGSPLLVLRRPDGGPAFQAP